MMNSSTSSFSDVTFSHSFHLNDQPMESATNSTISEACSSSSTEEFGVPTRRKKSYTVAFKLKVVRYFEKAGSKRATARHFGIDLRNIRY